jgi:glutathione S-transferase
MLRELAPTRYTTDASSAPGIQSAATEYVRRHFLLFEKEMGEGPFFLGGTFFVLDIYLWMLCYWMDRDWLVANCPKVNLLWSTAAKRPALARIALKHFA